MTIHGRFSPASGWPVPWLRVLLFLPGISPRWRPVTFLLDTGCAESILHPTDAAHRIGIPEDRLRQPALWPDVSVGMGVGGLATFRVPAQDGVLDESGRIELVEGQIRIAELTSASQSLPSLLGWDVLRDFEILINQRAGRVRLRRL